MPKIFRQPATAVYNIAVRTSLQKSYWQMYKVYCIAQRTLLNNTKENWHKQVFMWADMCRRDFLQVTYPYANIHIILF